MVDLTVLILTKNEENNIEKCINSFKGIAKRFVIVDSGSDDKTVEIAKSLGSDVYVNKFIDHATQLNWGLENTEIDTEWVMRMDADEELLEELVVEVSQNLSAIEMNISGIIINRRIHFMGKWIKHGGVYPTKMLRIFRNGKAFCEQKIMDEHMLLTEGKTIEFKNDFIDNNTKDIEWWTNKHNWYSTREVADYMKTKEQFEKGIVVKPNFFGNQVERKRWFKYILFYRTPLLKRAKWYFLYRYFFKLGFLDGKEGLIFHFLQGYWYRFLVDAKLYEKNKLNEV